MDVNEIVRKKCRICRAKSGVARCILTCTGCRHTFHRTCLKLDLDDFKQVELST